ncbi:hypothetical protein [Schumannella soli]|uniref:Uncharacterized protein n=1 Tax=Schumannella soli TaxID=2590779 RepID=A0A506XZ71_9MICO|nr:hypothetical protein [Schumannella soli]TPW78071.1 hypothetical protein FJ657_05440 [Schumannella soli]
MSPSKSSSVDYASQCTICIDYQAGERVDRIVYERPQAPVPDRPLTEADRVRLLRHPDDTSLTQEAQAIFADLKNRGELDPSAIVVGIFIARSAAAALEMGL